MLIKVVVVVVVVVVNEVHISFYVIFVVIGQE